MSYLTFLKEFTNGNRAVAIRVSTKTSPATIAEALELPSSSKVLLVIGGASLMSRELLDRLSAVFTVIGEVLSQIGVVVIDGGTQAGVMAMMGRALAKAGRSAPYIGVLPAHAKVEPEGWLAEDVLEPNHSHFVLIDSDEWGSEIRTMSDLAKYLSAGAPPLVLLANGGEIALRDVEWSIQEGREIVILVGSGRLADEIAEAVRHPERGIRDRVAAVTRDGRLTLFDISASPLELVEYLKHRLM